jgi:hypothetical protein
LREDTDTIPVDRHHIAVDLHVTVKTAVDRVVTRQMGIRFGIAKIIDGNDFDLIDVCALIQSAQNVTSNTPIPIDSYFNRHCHVPSHSSQEPANCRHASGVNQTATVIAIMGLCDPQMYLGSTSDPA